MESKLLTIHFLLPEGYKSADQYLKSIVEEQIQKRYDNTLEGLDERLLRAKSAVSGRLGNITPCMPDGSVSLV